MAKRASRTRRRRRVKQQERGTNWLLIGGVIGIAVIALFALLASSLGVFGESTPTPEPPITVLSDYCQDNPDNCISKGSPEAPITIMEVSDYGCGHCRDFNLETAGLLEDLYVTPGDVQWITVPYALGQGTIPAAEAAMCADDQERFSDFHHILFERQDELSSFINRDFTQVAEELDLNMDSFNACLDSAKYRRAVADNMDAAARAGVNSTPTFFINDKLMRGNQPLTIFQQEITRLLSVASTD